MLMGYGLFKLDQLLNSKNGDWYVLYNVRIVDKSNINRTKLIFEFCVKIYK